MRIQVVSDLHLEFKQNNRGISFTTGADVLALCGDIISSRHLHKLDLFLKDVVPHFLMIWYVAGNHELYQSKDVDKTYQAIEQVCAKYNNVYFLNRGCVDVGPYRVLGTTLWSKVEPNPRQITNDFDCIPKLTIQRYNQWHDRDRAWLESELQRARMDSKRVIVMTHHLPSYRMVPDKYRHCSTLNQFFASDCDDLIELSDLWLCGHSHGTKEQLFNQTPCILNAHGYPGEQTNFNCSKVVEI
jgi:predicted phosphodiesterase